MASLPHRLQQAKLVAKEKKQLPQQESQAGEVSGYAALHKSVRSRGASLQIRRKQQAFSVRTAFGHTKCGLNGDGGDKVTLSRLDDGGALRVVNSSTQESPGECRPPSL